MRAGKLKDRAELIEAQTTANKYDEEVEVWGSLAPPAKAWVHVMPLTGKEVQAEHAKLNIQGYKVRYRPRKSFPVSVDKRFLWNGKTLEIETPPIDPYGRGDELSVICKEIVNA